MLVTGAGGSIGSEIARQIAQYRPARLLLLDRDDSLLFEVVSSLDKAEPILADIRDESPPARDLRAPRARRRVPRRRAQARADPRVAPGRSRADQRARHVDARAGRGRPPLPARAHLHRQGRRPVLGHGREQARRRARGALDRQRARAAVRRGALRQRARQPRQRGADVLPPDRRGRAGHRDRPRDDPLLHDDPRSRQPRAPGRRDGRQAQGLRARDGPAGQDHRARPPDDPPRRAPPRRGHQDRDRRHPSRRAPARVPARRRRDRRAHVAPVDPQPHARRSRPIPTRLSYFLDVWRRCCAGAHEQVVVGLLDQMLTECGVECHLDADVARAAPARRAPRARSTLAAPLTAPGAHRSHRPPTRPATTAARAARRHAGVRARPAVRPARRARRSNA